MLCFAVSGARCMRMHFATIAMALRIDLQCAMSSSLGHACAFVSLLAMLHVFSSKSYLCHQTTRCRPVHALLTQGATGTKPSSIDLKNIQVYLSSSMGMFGSGVTSEPVASKILSPLTVCLPPSSSDTSISFSLLNAPQPLTYVTCIRMASRMRIHT